MDALTKTENLIRIDKFPLALLEGNEDNPNKMSKRAFDLLVDNMNRTGWTDAILARPLKLKEFIKAVEMSPSPEDTPGLLVKKGLKARVVGGHHRLKAATYLGFEHGPVVLVTDPEFDDEAETFQLVRMNAIRGNLDPEAFFNLYNKYASKYTPEVLQDAFGFSDQSEFNKLITQMAKVLPDKVTQDKFKEAAKEIKTIDGLSKLLNQMFTNYGDHLKYGYMVVDYGGQKSVWLRIDNPKTWKAVELLGDICVSKKRTMDDLFGGVLQLIAKGEAPDLLDKLVSMTKAIEMPEPMLVPPTKENLEKMGAL